MLRQVLCLLLAGALLQACSNAEITVTPVSAGKWKGEWEHLERLNSASLFIDSLAADSIHFTITAASGANTGEIEGKAAIRGNRVVFELAEASDTCRLIFEMQGDSLISIDQQAGQCGAGAGVSFGGKYTKAGAYVADLHEGAPEEGLENDDLIALGILRNPAEDSVFRALVKKDYDLFVRTTQLVSEDEDLDSLGAKVSSSAVRGLYTQMENIIMVDSARHFWAAVIDDGKVYYYTNRPLADDKLPATIDKWRSGFKEYPVSKRYEEIE